MTELRTLNSGLFALLWLLTNSSCRQFNRLHWSQRMVCPANSHDNFEAPLKERRTCPDYEVDIRPQAIRGHEVILVWLLNAEIGCIAMHRVRVAEQFAAVNYFSSIQQLDVRSEKKPISKNFKESQRISENFLKKQIIGDYDLNEHFKIDRMRRTEREKVRNWAEKVSLGKFGLVSGWNFQRSKWA